MIYLENPYYYVYEVIIYWKNWEGVLKSFYKIGLIKVESEDEKLNYRYKKEIEFGCKVFIINLLKFDNYDDTSKTEELMLRLAFKDNIDDFRNPKLKYLSGTQTTGDLRSYPNYFAGMTEAFETPKRFYDLLSKLDKYFDQNPDVFIPTKFNKDLENKLNLTKT